MSPKTMLRTYAVSFLVGALLCVILRPFLLEPPPEHHPHPTTITFHHSTEGEVPLKQYDAWFKESGLKKHLVSSDELRYGPSAGQGEVEAAYLSKKVTLLCAVYTQNPKYARAVNETWTASCNKVMYYSKHREEVSAKVGNKFNTTSSFHLLCDVLRRIADEYPAIKWVLFVKDDMFVIPENLRRLVAPLDPEEGHYLGHAINFWGVEYNMAQSGFILSQGAIRKFVEKFPNTSSCIAGGKYWKQEDMYLGKHLKEMQIKPVDTRDAQNYTAFLGYDLDKMMFPGSTQYFTTYSTRALYPVKCCGSLIITFPVLSSTEMYTFYYMIHTMRIFEGGTNGNRPLPTSTPDIQVWQDFLRSEGQPLNVSNSRYEEIWYRKIGTAKIVRPDKSYFYTESTPNGLEPKISSFTSKRSFRNDS